MTIKRYDFDQTGCEEPSDNGYYVRFDDHVLFASRERVLGFVEAFDLLTYRAANTDDDVIHDELIDIAHELLKHAPEWRDRWKQIQDMNREIKDLKKQLAEKNHD